MNHQIDLFEYLSREDQTEDETQVEIEGAVNVRATPIADFKVRLATGDLTLIIAVLHDYVRQIDEMLAKNEEPPNYHRALWEYYREKFKSIAGKIGKQIDYDYEAKKAKCEKEARKKASTSDIGEDAMMLAVKYAKGAKTKPKEGKENDTGKKDNEAPKATE